MADRWPEWTRRRPATTVLADPRIATPSAKDRDPNWQPGDKWPHQFKNAVRVSTEEAAVLQGFRPNYPWQGSRTCCFLQIGNAVCPPVATRVLAEAMRPSVCPEGRRDG